MPTHCGDEACPACIVAGDFIYLARLIFQSTLPVGGATQISNTSRRAPSFQSTLPVGGATDDGGAGRMAQQYFNPRSPWGERLPSLLSILLMITISIHAPRGGSDVAD